MKKNVYRTEVFIDQLYRSYDDNVDDDDQEKEDQEPAPKKAEYEQEYKEKTRKREKRKMQKFQRRPKKQSNNIK